MGESEYQSKRDQLAADWTAGRIADPEFRQRLDELQRLRTGVESQAAGESSITLGGGTSAIPVDPADPGATIVATRFPSGSSNDATVVAKPGGAQRGDTSLSPGRQLGTYQLMESVGRGAFGEVWKAYSSFEERFVALKVLPDELSRDAEEMGRVRQCFNRIHHLQHEHICPMYGLAHDEQIGYYLIMKFVAGVSLAGWRDRLTQPDPQFEKSLSLLSMAARALDYAHQQKVVHRDVKPANMLVASDGSDLQVVDFGLADQIHSSLSRVGAGTTGVVGTPAYMSPEACRGMAQTGASDQYSLACVAYFLLAGRPPFEGNPLIVINCHRLETPQPVEGIPAAANAVLMRALAKEARERFASCVEFSQSLRQAVQGAGAVGRVASRQPPATPAPRQAGDSLSGLTALLQSPPPAEARSIRPPASQAARPVEPPSTRSHRWRSIGKVAAETPVALAFSKSEEQMAAVFSGGSIVAWARDAVGGKLVQPAAIGPICDAAWIPQSGLLVLAGQSELAALDATVTRLVSSAKLPALRIRAISTSDNSRLIACLGDAGKIHFVDLVTGKAIRTAPTHLGQPACFRLANRGDSWAEASRDGVFVVTPGTSTAASGARKVLEPRGAPTLVRFSPDDRLLAAHFDDGTIGVADLRSGSNLLIQQTGVELRGLAFSANGDRVYAAASDASLRAFNTSNGSIRSEFPLTESAVRVAVSARVRVFVVLADGQVLVSDDLRSEESRSGGSARGERSSRGPTA